MKDYLRRIDKALLGVIRQIGAEADRRRMQAYIVGGVVRDVVLSRPTADLDVTVEGDGLVLARAMAHRWKVPVQMHSRFGTGSLILGHMSVDFASTRKEHYRSPGALPTVRPGSFTEDLFRRDFTVNAMAIAINHQVFGVMADPFGGLKDLEARKIRVLHDESFIDDPTRILRAVRFEQRFGFRIEPRTLLLLKTALHNRAETRVTRPRYFAEFRKILKEADPSKSLRRLETLKALRFLGNGAGIDLARFCRVLAGLLKLKKSLPYRQILRWDLIYLISLFSGSDSRWLPWASVELHLTKEEQISIRQIRQRATLLSELSRARMPASAVYKLLKPLRPEVIAYFRASARSRRAVSRIDTYMKNHQGVKLSITGDDLKKAGVPSGKGMKRILDELLKLKIDRKIKSKREELEWALTLFRNS